MESYGAFHCPCEGRVHKKSPQTTLHVSAILPVRITRCQDLANDNLYVDSKV